MAETFPSFWKAEHDFVGDEAGAQLSFKKGDTFLMIERHESGWFTAERNMERGYVPGNFFSKIEPKRKTQPQNKVNLEATSDSGITRSASSNGFPGPLEVTKQSKTIDSGITRAASSNSFPGPSTTKATGNPRPPIPTSAPTQFKPNEAAAPPIPLRTDLGEKEQEPEEPEIPEVDESINLTLLKAENVFLKYAKRGKPQKRIISIDNSLTKITWREVDKTKIEGFILVNNVIGTKKGHTSKKLVKNANLKIAMSIICSDETKTLELDAETPELRNEWLINFQLLLRQNATDRLTGQ